MVFIKMLMEEILMVINSHFQKFSKNGYETAVIGKWHLGTTPTGFDYSKVLINWVVKVHILNLNFV